MYFECKDFGKCLLAAKHLEQCTLYGECKAFGAMFVECKAF
jgi:hypothetical protein